jgi:hypothetical protein
MPSLNVTMSAESRHENKVLTNLTPCELWRDEYSPLVKLTRVLPRDQKPVEDKVVLLAKNNILLIQCNIIHFLCYVSNILGTSHSIVQRRASLLRRILQICL